MHSLNKFKLDLYNMIYNFPPCAFVNDGEAAEKHSISVLFVGIGVEAGECAVEAYKTLFWASQFPDTIIDFTAAMSEEHISFAKEQLSDKEKYPLLEEYITEKEYARPCNYVSINNIQDQIINESVTLKKCVKDLMKSINLDNKEYSYIICATENELIDREIISQMEDFFDKKGKEKKILFGVYDRNLEKFLSMVNKEKLVMEIFQFETIEEDFWNSELYHVAQNINLAYSVKYNQRLNIEKVNEDFRKECKNEFESLNYEGYNADSSFACAAHISSKLSVCNPGYIRQDRGMERAIEILAEAIKEKSKLFEDLTLLEHKRWRAYMVTKGYRLPNDEEFKSVYSEKGKRHVNKADRWHMCLCDAKSYHDLEDMEALADRFWNEAHSHRAKLSTLDKVSLYCNRQAELYTKKLEGNIWKDHMLLSSVLFTELKESIQALFRNESNAVNKYQKSFCKAIRSVYAKDEVKRELEEIDKELENVIFYNQNVRFQDYDAQLISFLPFSLWYGRDYETVVIFSDNNPTVDVVIPTLVYAKNVIIVGIPQEEKDYYSAIVTDYFESRGGNTSISFITYEELCKIIVSKKDQALIVCGAGSDKAMFIRDFSQTVKIIVLEYDPESEQITGDSDLFSGIESQSFSIDEYIGLLGGSIKSTNYDRLDEIDFKNLSDVFWLYSKETKLDDNKSFIPWNIYEDIFVYGKEEENRILINKPTRSEAYICDISIDADRFVRNSIEATLVLLEDYHLINLLECISKEEKVEIRFITYHKEIAEAFKKYSSNHNAEAPVFEIKECDNKVDYLLGFISPKYSIDKARQYCQENKINNRIDFSDERDGFYKKLEEYGLANQVVLNKRGHVTSVFVSDLNVARILSSSEGALFEQIVYRRIADSGYFDDVRSGVYFAWNRRKTKNMNIADSVKRSMDEKSRDDILALCTLEDFDKAFTDEKRIKWNAQQDNQAVENEIDVIAIRGMQAYFVSCKNRAFQSKEFLYELGNEMKKANARGIFATSQSLRHLDRKNFFDSFKSRAFEDGISFIGRENLMNEENFNETMSMIVKGEVVCITD